MDSAPRHKFEIHIQLPPQILEVIETMRCFLVNLNKAIATAAFADTIKAWPEGKAYSASAESMISSLGIKGLGLCTISFASIPRGIRIIMQMAIMTATFFPILPPNANMRIIVTIQNTSLP